MADLADLVLVLVLVLVLSTFVFGYSLGFRKALREYARPAMHDVREAQDREHEGLDREFRLLNLLKQQIDDS